MKVGLKHFLTGVALFGSLHTRAYAQDNIVYDTSPSSGRVVSIRVEDTAPIKLPAVEIPVNASSQEIASAIAQLASATPQPSPSPAPLKYARMVRSSNPIITATSFARTYGKAFGLANPSRELSPLKVERDSIGMSHVRFKQTYKGIPVFGAELTGHVGVDGQVNSLGGKVGSGINVNVRPRITKSRAEKIAKEHFKKKYPLLAPKIDKSALYIYQPSILDNSSSLAAYLVWHSRLWNEQGVVDESYLVDAASGEIRLTTDNVRHLNRRVFDCSADLGRNDQCYSNLYVAEFDYTFGCREGTCPHGPNPRYSPEVSTDTDDMYAMLENVHDYYQTKFGRNSVNGQGGNTDGTRSPIDMDAGWTYINWTSSWDDNCLSARYWLNQGVYICKDIKSPDLIGHESAHGVNYNLIFQNETGALDESHSDYMGEMLEYWLTGSNDWLFPSIANFQGKRNLEDPSSLIDPFTNQRYPDRYTSDLYYCGSFDYGGGHVNSTVPSKALHLATVGGTFNGCTITGIGREKVEQIIHRSKTQYYAPSENFSTAYSHQIQSCVDLYGEAAPECTNFSRALQAVEMDQVGKCDDPTHQFTMAATCQCQDSDDWRGAGRFVDQARTVGSVDYDRSVFRDICLNKNMLIENFCKNGKQKRVLVKCDNGCVDGACG